MMVHHHHDHGGDDHAGAVMPQDRGAGGGLSDTCCALHAYFAGVMPPLIAIPIGRTIGKPLAAGSDNVGFGITPPRLDRPPRPLRSL